MSAARPAQGGQEPHASRQIPRDEWRDFLVRFTRFNEETTVRVEVVGSDAAGTQLMAEQLPLLSVTVDSEAGAPRIVIECGDTAGGTPSTFRHVIHNPTDIWARHTDPVGWDALEVESRDEGTLILTVNPHPGRGALSFEEIGRSDSGLP